MMLMGIIILGTIFYFFYVKDSKDCNCDHDIKEIICFSCSHALQEDFQYCPYCKEKLKKTCQGCGKLMKMNWRKCPYCNHANDN